MKRRRKTYFETTRTDIGEKELKNRKAYKEKQRRMTVAGKIQGVL